jgi:hypothetical protein
MLKPGLTRLLRRVLILLFISAFLAAASSSSLPPQTQASNPNYYCSVWIVSEVNADHDCWQVYSQGSGCSSISFTDAHNKAITDALNNMPPNCSWQPFRIDSESCVDGSSCTP